LLTLWDVVSRTQDDVLRIPSPQIRENCLLAAGCWLLAAGYWLLAAGCWLLAAGSWLLAAGFCLLAAGCWLLAEGGGIDRHRIASM
jgi:hypothetical protein